MKLNYKTALLFISLLVFTGCDDVVQIKLDEGSKIYVIDAFVNDLRSPQTIKVTTNDSYFSNKEAPPVNNAVVELVDLTSNTTYNFPHTNNGNYVFDVQPTQTISVLGHQYMLKVTIDGNVYTSTTTQKRTAVIDSIGSYYNEKDDPFGGKANTFTCFLFAKDKADNNPDYYWIKTYRNDTLFSGSGEINICVDGTGGEVYDAQGDSIDFTPPSIFIGGKSYKENDVCKVEIHSIARDTYFFFIQAFNQINNSGLFATTPENIKTNISTPGSATKAIGWFNMATVASKSRINKK